MPLIDQLREKALIELAKARFDPDLTEAERKVLRDSASSEDLPDPDENAPRPEIRPAFLRWLATDPEAAPHIDPKGLRVYAANIPGALDLRECHVNPTLDFRRCGFQGEINLQSAETRGLYILDSSLAGGILADGVIVHGPLFLRRIQSDGEIRLLGAEIAGQLACNGAKLRAKDNALSADGAKIAGGVFLKDGFESDGEIRLLGAQITGQLNCTGAKLKAKGNAIDADGAKIAGGVFLKDGFESDGEIRLLGAQIAGQLACNGAKLRAKGNALYADGAKIAGGVFLKDGFESEGEIRLPGAEIAGQLNCTGAKLRATGNALIADGAKIGGDVFLMDGFESEGTIRLLGAEIGGNLQISGAKVAWVACLNTVIKGDLIWQRVEKSKTTRLNLIGAKVKNLRDDKESWPEEENLDIDGLVYEDLSLHPLSSEEDIKAGQYAPELPLIAKERIQWIMLQPPRRRTEPQPWMQLRDLLEKKGDRKGAKYVLFRFRCLQAQKSWFLWRRLKIIFAWLEENPLRIGWSIALTLSIGTGIFTWGGSKQAMIETVRLQPAMIRSYEEAKTDRPVPNKPVSDHYPHFQPFVYTLENAVPLVKLGIDEKWAPDPRPEFCQPWLPSWRWLYFISTYGILSFSRWGLIVWGWVQATVLAAALADRFKK
jgi:hypothetical protein